LAGLVGPWELAWYDDVPQRLPLLPLSGKDDQHAVFLRIRGKLHYLWRAVDQDGHVLVLVQSRCGAKAAQRFFHKQLKGLQHVPRVIVTDKLRGYAAAKGEILPSVEHRQGTVSLLD